MAFGVTIRYKSLNGLIFDVGNLPTMVSVTSDLVESIFGTSKSPGPGGFDFFFGISNPGCYTKNPYKPPIFFLDSYSPTHKLSK